VSFRLLYNKILTSMTVIIECVSRLINVTDILMLFDYSETSILCRVNHEISFLLYQLGLVLANVSCIGQINSSLTIHILPCKICPESVFISKLNIDYSVPKICGPT
jgi:hypothetical protein